MRRAGDGPLLSPEELDLLQSLFAPGSGAELSRGRVALPLDAAADGPLGRYLASLGPLSLVASRERLELAFPAQLVEDPGTSHLALEVGFPSITDHHPSHDRRLRVRPSRAGEILVSDLGGHLTAPEVVDLSASGVSLWDVPPARLEVGATVEDLLIRLPEGAVRASAQVVRWVGEEDGRVRMALSLKPTDAEAEAILAAYVFRRFHEEIAPWDEDPFSDAR